jgi:predicted nucleic acid-binding protein
LDKLLTSLGYSLVVAPRGGATIADPKDAPILNAAILENADMIISRDNHFLSLVLERPKILTPAQYLDIIEGDA